MLPAANIDSDDQKGYSMSERWITIRVYGTLLHATGAWGDEDGDGVAGAVPLTEDHIDEWMRGAADGGATGVLWQSNCGGTSTHPSPVFQLAGPPCRTHNEHWTPVWEYLGEQVRRFDTLSVAVETAHRHGLRLVYSLCPCDFVDSPFEESPFHPKLWVMSRRGEPYHGVPCYAEPKAQDLVLAHVSDVLDHGVDDLAISFFSHMMGQGTNQSDYYGFNPPALKAYQERHGVDPLRSGIDPDLWHALHGDFYTKFVERLHELTSKGGQRLIPCAVRDGRWGWGGSSGQELAGQYFMGNDPPTRAPAFGLEFQWQRWAEQGIADALLMADPIVDAQAARGTSGLPVILWRHTSPLTEAARLAEYDDDARQVATGALDGFAAHAMVFSGDHYQGYRDQLAGLMRSATPAPAPGE